MNMQNLTRGGELRLSILAPKGYAMCVQDSGQIEARVNAWLWGQQDLLDAFATADKWNKKTMGVATGDNRDAYCRFADSVYGREITTDDSTERFVGKVCVLGLGYQMGGPKLQMTLAKGALGGPPVYFSLEQCKGIVTSYRAVNHRIANGWNICKRIIEDMAIGREGSHGPINWEANTIWLPNGMALKYPDLQKSTDENGWDAWTYQSGDQRKKIYGGLLCLGAKTQVLTDNGWKSIICVRLNDKLWDGANWVSHSGLTHQGVKETISFGGVDMTPDHEVLVNNHWFAAEETTHHEATSSFKRHHWAPDRHDDSSQPDRQRRATNFVDRSMPVWQHTRALSHGIREGQYEELRMRDDSIYIRVKNDARNVETSCLRGVAGHARPLQSTEPSGLGTLRRARDYCLSAVDGLSDLLVRYACWVQAGLRAGPPRQFVGIQSGELSLGDKQSQLSQQTLRAAYSNAQRPLATMASCRGVRDWQNDAALPTHSQLARRTDVRQPERQQQDVYDLLNAGPLSRFTVRGDDGQPFIVHNCENIVQALARIVVMWQMLQTNKKHRCVMTTHDEIVAIAKLAAAQKCVDHMAKWMRTPPPWCPDLVLNTEGGWAENYSK